ncbi:DUF5431 family protein [Pseudescherichia vulneris]|uniref:DUF5431 family protein n=1 Tax=Pseudescherichia vulneris TaxID=566 RepID=UPI0028D559B5|nr:DUF5431 family protein [Pseudescherichia vulneris]
MFQLTNEACSYARQHQSSRLPAARQGEEGYEAAMERSYLVRIDSVFNAVDIHLADAKITV